MKTVQRILVRSPNWIGDQVLAYPFFYELRRAFPDAWISTVCVPWVESMQYRDLINEVIVLPRPSTGTLSEKWAYLRRCKEQVKGGRPHWDLGFVLPPSFSSAWLMHQVGVERRVGFSGDGRRFLLTHTRAWPEAHRAQAYLDLLDVAQIPSPHGAEWVTAARFWPQAPTPELRKLAQNEVEPGVLERFDAKRAWPDFTPEEIPNEPYWVLAPGSMAESRRWEVERFVELARIIHRETGWKGCVVGGPAEAPIAQRLQSAAHVPLLDYTARGGVPVLSRLFENAQFTVSNDSGLAHVASLCGSPTCLVWGAGNPRVTAPLGPGLARTVFASPECWPCEKNQCPLSGDQKLQCLRMIHPADVWQEIQKGFLEGGRGA